MKSTLTNILVIGGTGHFGARICRRLLGEPGIRLFVSSRSASLASQFASHLRQLSPDTPVEGVELDQTAQSFESDLAKLRPAIVIHTAGPFQGQDYRVAKACAACGSHYIDLADGRDFVKNFAASLNDLAKEADVLLVSGASTMPGLSSAVIGEITQHWRSIEHIEISIAPAQQTPRGLSTIGAVLSYCGKPFNILVNGTWTKHYGWQSLKAVRYPQLGYRLSAVCDVPDLAILPEHYPQLKSVIFRASLESKTEHLALWICATFARLGLVADWSRSAGLFRSLSRVSQRLGSDKGGMRIEVRGLDGDGAVRQCEWNLLAQQNHGPEIPVSPALVLTRKILHDELILRGAFPCMGLMSLQDFAIEVSQLNISWQCASQSR